MSLRHFTSRFFTVGPYAYADKPLPTAGAGSLAFLSAPLPRYNPIGAGVQNARGIGTVGAQNIPRLIGIVGPGGYQSGQVYNPPLLPTGTP